MSVALKPDAPRTGLVAALLSISKSMRAIHGLKLAKLDLHNGQDELLLGVAEDGTTVTDVADMLLIRASTVSKMKTRLCAQGLIHLKSDNSDGRITLLFLTPKGTAKRKLIELARRELETDLGKALLIENRPDFLNTLEECASLLQTRLNRYR